MPGEQIEIRIPSLRLVHRDMDWRDISIDLVDVRIRAIYKPTWDVRVFDGIHRNIVRLMGFLCSFIPLLPLIALSPIFIASSLACNIIKVFHSRKNSLEHFQVERIENVNSEHQTTEFIDLCLRKLDQVLNSKK